MKHNHKILLTSIYLMLLIIIPKEINELFGFIPLRLTLSIVFVIINFIDILKNKEFKIRGKWYGIIYLLFLLYTVPSLFVSKNIFTFLYTFAKFFVALLVFLIIYNTDFTKEDIKTIFKYFIIGVLISSIYGLIQYLFDINLFKIGLGNYTGAKGRISSTFFNTIYFGIFLNITIPILTYVLFKVQNIKNKIIVSVVLVLTYISLLLTFTRSALIIFILCLIGTMILNSRIIFNKITLPIYVLMISLSFLIPGVSSLYQTTYLNVKEIFTEKLVDKFLPNLKIIEQEKKDEETEKVVGEALTNNNKPKDKYISDASLNNRIRFSNIANQIALDNLGVGIGFGGYDDYLNSKDYETTYPQFSKHKTYPHSAVVLMYAEVSVCALVCYCIYLISLILSYLIKWIKNVKKLKSVKELSVLGLAILLGFIVINLVAENAIYDSQVYPIFMIINGLIMSIIFTEQNKVKGSIK